MPLTSPSEPPHSGTARPRPPVSVRVALIALTVLAVLLLVGSLLTWLGRDGVVDRFVADSPGAERADVAQLVLIGLSRDAFLGGLAAVAAWFLGQRRGWARWVGVTVALILGLSSLISSFAARGTTPYALLLVVLCAAATSSLLARTTKDWLAARSPTG